MTQLEMIAEALWNEAGVGKLTPWRNAPKQGRDKFLGMARAAVRAQMGPMTTYQYEAFAADDLLWRERTASSVIQRSLQLILDEPQP